MILLSRRRITIIDEPGVRGDARRLGPQYQPKPRARQGLPAPAPLSSPLGNNRAGVVDRCARRADLSGPLIRQLQALPLGVLLANLRSPLLLLVGEITILGPWM